MKKTTLFLSMLAIGCMSANAQTEKKKNRLVMNTTVSIFSNQNFGSYFFSEKEGQISTGGRASDFGFGISKDFYILPKGMFLSVGLKYYETSSVIDVKNSIEGINPNSGAHYTANYGHFVVPVYVGKTFRLFKGSKAHLTTFGGISAGISRLINFQTDSFLEPANNDNGPFSLSSTAPILGGPGFYSSVDAGFRVTPFNFPNLTVGATATLDVTKSQAFAANGLIKNEGRQLSEAHNFNCTRRFFNVMLQVNYTFGKRWKSQL